jgi:hypothetical protein
MNASEASIQQMASVFNQWLTSASSDSQPIAYVSNTDEASLDTNLELLLVNESVTLTGTAAYSTQI